MKYHVIVFGCQMNISDAERVASVLESAGLKQTENIESADVIVVTMCSIRQSAVDRVHGLVEKFKKLRATNHKLQTILTGCVLQKDKAKFINGFNHIVDIKEIAKIPGLIKARQPIRMTSGYLDIEPKRTTKFSASIPVMTGCNNFCAYCVVPYTREREVSRKAEDILREFKNALKNGIKEIWLLGQNVNSYKGTYKSKPIKFAKLLQLVNQLPGEFWVRYTSSHPKDFTDEVIDAMSDGQHITPYLNLPIQSGDNQVLKSMNRHYTVAQYKNIIKKIRKKIPGICISTDIIVGFPGETKKQFENTVKLFRDVKYDMAYINKFSPRAGTAAAKLEDNVSWEEKKRREKVLTDTLKKIALEKNKKLVGEIVPVLIETEKNGIFYGKSDTYQSIKIKPSPYSRELAPGKFVNIKITKAGPFTLEGQLAQ